MMNALAPSSTLGFASTVPVREPDACGVAIDVDVSMDAPVYSVYLLAGDGTRARRMALTTDERAARRVWTLLARSLHVPRFIAQVGGGLRALDTIVGSLVARPPAPRRGRRVAIRRRPSSRRTKASAGAPAIHAGEREIVCYE